MHGIYKANEVEITDCVIDLDNRIIPVAVVSKAMEFNAYMPPQYTHKRDMYYCPDCRILCCSGEYLMIPPPYDNCTHTQVIRFKPEDFDISKSSFFYRKYHELKCDAQYYADVVNRKKKFELRKNDRNFQVGDIVFLRETENGLPTGRRSDGLEIQYILYGPVFGLAEGWCIMNFFTHKR